MACGKLKASKGKKPICPVKVQKVCTETAKGKYFTCQNCPNNK